MLKKILGNKISQEISRILGKIAINKNNPKIHRKIKKLSSRRGPAWLRGGGRGGGACQARDACSVVSEEGRGLEGEREGEGIRGGRERIGREKQQAGNVVDTTAHDWWSMWGAD